MSTWSNFQSPNIGLLYNKHIYQEQTITQKIYEQKGELLINTTEKSSEFDEFYNDMCDYVLTGYSIENVVFGNTSLYLKTVYPGLLIGSGYTHDTKAEGDFKIGFYFDHTSGLPRVPGSSVKGVLRSIFEKDTDDEGFNYTGEKSVLAIKFILCNIIENEKKLQTNILESLKNIYNGINAEELVTIKETIFGGSARKGCDIFFDCTLAVQEGKFISKDFLTPHKLALKNPVPLQFLKVLPGVAFQLNFFLTDGGWTKEIKALIFKHIILSIGLGAKTNVGYGQFVDSQKPLDKTSTPLIEKKVYQFPGSSVLSNLLAKGSILKAIIVQVKSDTEFDAEVFLGNKSLGKQPLKTNEYLLKKAQTVAVEVKGITKGKITSIRLTALQDI